MGPGALGTTYCSFTKAIEHLGDRWSLFIIRALGIGGPQGFNALAAGLPGRVSRSVLADRLRRLEDLGLVARPDRGNPGPYRLTTSGEALMPTLRALWQWSETWLPDDPDLADRDPDVVVAWLASRLDRRSLPDRQVVVEIVVRGETVRRYWLVCERGAAPYGCLTDPLLDASTYLYLHTGLPTLLLVARGRRSVADALADGSVTAFGNPELVRAVARSFRPRD